MYFAHSIEHGIQRRADCIFDLEHAEQPSREGDRPRASTGGTPHMHSRHMQGHPWYQGQRIGEATNPGPTPMVGTLGPGVADVGAARVAGQKGRASHPHTYHICCANISHLYSNRDQLPDKQADSFFGERNTACAPSNGTRQESPTSPGPHIRPA